MALEEVGLRATVQGLNPFLAGVGQIDSAFGRLSTGAVLFGNLVADAFWRVQAAITGLVGDTVETAATFEEQMAIMEVASRGAGSSIDEMRAFAIKMGRETLFGATDAADAMITLFKAGMTAQEVYDTLPAAVNLATASNLGLEESAFALVQMMTTFGISTSDAVDIVDNLVQSADASVLEVDELTQAMVNAGPTVSMFGMTLEEANTALAILSDRGIRGSEAGTLLGRMLLNMNRNTKKVKGAWDELGVSLYDAEGNLRPIPDVFADLNVKLGENSDMTEEARNEWMQTVFGTYGIRAGKILIEEGATGWAEMSAQIDSAATAADMASAKINVYTGDIERLHSEIESLMIKAGTPLIDEFLEPLVEQITADVIPALNDFIDALVGGEGLQAAIQTLLPEGAEGNVLARFVLLIAENLDALFATLQSMSPDELQETARGLALVLAVFNRNTLIRLGTGGLLFMALTSALEGITNALSALGRLDIKGVIQGIAEGLSQITIDLGALIGVGDISGGLMAWGGVVQNLATIISTAFENVKTTITGTWTSLFDPAYGIVPHMWHEIWKWEQGGVIYDTIMNLKTHWDTFWTETIPAALSYMVQAIGTAWWNFWKWEEGGVIYDIMMAIKRGWDTFWTETVPNAIIAAKDAIIDAIRQAIIDPFRSAFEDIGKIQVPGTGKAVWEVFAEAIPGFQAGGVVRSGIPALVGETGPELFVPQTNGAILPANQTADLLAMLAGGGRGLTINNYGPVYDAEQIEVNLRQRAALYGFGSS